MPPDSSTRNPLAGGGETGALMRSIAWSGTAVGPVDGWPQSLRTALSILLESGFPMYIAWGKGFTQFYNDAYRPILGSTKHPAAMGISSRETFAEIWDIIGPMFDGVMRGTPVSVNDFLLPLDRHGFVEECYFIFSYSPIREETGNVGGVLVTVTETTERILGARRLVTLQELSAKTRNAATADGACELAASVLAENPDDVPFALLYLLDEHGRTATLAGSARALPGSAWAPTSIDLDGASAVWPLAMALAEGAMRTVPCPGGAVHVTSPRGEPSVEVRRARVLPIATPGAETPSGFLVAGLSPRLLVDTKYESFLELVAGHVGSAISSARSLAEARARAEALAEIDRAKTTFFSNASHEFRTPLTLMLAPIQDMLALGAGAVVDRATVELLHRNALRLLKLVNTLLEFSRIEAGRVEAVYEPVDLASLTAELASNFRATVERAGLALVVDCPPLPEPIFVDRDMWEKIVLNLLSNAFKFTFEGSLQVRLRLDGASARLEVADTGTGIPPEELPRLFERFHRIEGARSRSHEGSGIGLALILELARLHGGDVRVTSRLGEGTTFSVAIPRGSAHLPPARIRSARTLPATALGAAAYVEEAMRWALPGAPEQTPSQPPLTTEPYRRGRERIVFADDNADMRDYVSRLLRERWTVEAVGDGAAALDAVRRDPPDLVLCDVMMPRLDGFGLVQAIRSDAALRATPIIILSARAGEEETAKGLGSGANDYIAKPFSARELLVRVASMLAAARVRREMRAAEEAQRANLYRNFMQAPFPIAIFRGPNHVIELANAESLRAWGKGPEVVGQPIAHALPELRGQPFVGWMDGVFESGVSYEGREELARLPRGPHGELEEVYFNFVYAPLRDAEGAVEGVLLSAFIVTEQVLARRELERALERTKKSEAERTLALEQAERASRAKDEFLATMSHELRTPLTAMLGWASMLLSGYHEPAKLEHGLAVIERNARAQARLVGDLLDVSRIVSGKLRLHVIEIDVSEIIRAAVDVVRQAAEAKGVRLVVALDPALGKLAADPDRLQQIVWNILANAVKFTPAGGSITVTAEREAAFVRIQVRDTGVGIASEHLPFIFERLRQIDGSTTRTHGGLGLGLAIVRHLAEAHGGTVTAESEGPGTGTRFLVCLPARTGPLGEEEEERNRPASERPPPRRPGRAELGGARILIVEDDPDSLELLQLILEEAGARVSIATSARQALEESGQTRFDLVISDIGMPEMDGYAFVAHLRARDGGALVPAIALTAYARPEDAAVALASGFQRHMTKPIDARVLVATVKEMTGRG